MLQQWLGHTPAPGVAAEDRRRLDLLVHGATPQFSLCCDATCMARLTHTGLLQPCAADMDGAALRVAERRTSIKFKTLDFLDVFVSFVCVLFSFPV